MHFKNRDSDARLLESKFIPLVHTDLYYVGAYVDKNLPSRWIGHSRRSVDTATPAFLFMMTTQR